MYSNANAEAIQNHFFLHIRSFEFFCNAWVQCVTHACQIYCMCIDTLLAVKSKSCYQLFLTARQCTCYPVRHKLLVLWWEKKVCCWLFLLCTLRHNKVLKAKVCIWHSKKKQLNFNANSRYYGYMSNNNISKIRAIFSLKETSNQ